DPAVGRPSPQATSLNASVAAPGKSIAQKNPAADHLGELNGELGLRTTCRGTETSRNFHITKHIGAVVYFAPYRRLLQLSNRTTANEQPNTFTSSPPIARLGHDHCGDGRRSDGRARGTA